MYYSKIDIHSKIVDSTVSRLLIQIRINKGKYQQINQGNNKMKNLKKLQSFRMHQDHLDELKRISKEKNCTQISILEKALQQHFKEYEFEGKQGK